MAWGSLEPDTRHDEPIMSPLEVTAAIVALFSAGAAFLFALVDDWLIAGLSMLVAFTSWFVGVVAALTRGKR